MRKYGKKLISMLMVFTFLFTSIAPAYAESTATSEFTDDDKDKDVLMKGSDLNEAMKKLAGDVDAFEDIDEQIQSFAVSDEPADEGVKTISVDLNQTGSIQMWYEEALPEEGDIDYDDITEEELEAYEENQSGIYEETRDDEQGANQADEDLTVTETAEKNTDKNTIYIYSEEPIRMNPDSSYMFYGMKALEMIDGIEKLDASEVESLAHMFEDDESLADITPIGNLNTSSLKDVSYMLRNTAVEDVSILEPHAVYEKAEDDSEDEAVYLHDSWDVSVDFEGAFDETYVEELPSWCVEEQTDSEEAEEVIDKNSVEENNETEYFEETPETIDSAEEFETVDYEQADEEEADDADDTEITESDSEELTVKEQQVAEIEDVSVSYSNESKSPVKLLDEDGNELSGDDANITLFGTPEAIRSISKVDPRVTSMDDLVMKTSASASITRIGGANTIGMYWFGSSTIYQVSIHKSSTNDLFYCIEMFRNSGSNTYTSTKFRSFHSSKGISDSQILAGIAYIVANGAQKYHKPSVNSKYSIGNSGKHSGEELWYHDAGITQLAVWGFLYECGAKDRAGGACGYNLSTNHYTSGDSHYKKAWEIAQKFVKDALAYSKSHSNDKISKSSFGATYSDYNVEFKKPSSEEMTLIKDKKYYESGTFTITSDSETRPTVSVTSPATIVVTKELSNGYKFKVRIPAKKVKQGTTYYSLVATAYETRSELGIMICSASSGDQQLATSMTDTYTLPHYFDARVYTKLDNTPVRIKKVSSNAKVSKGDAHYSLSGAVYGLYKTKQNAIDGKKAVITLTTKDSGVSDSKELEAGTYWVKETKAPKGYILNDKPFKVTIEASSKTVTIDVKDQPYPKGKLKVTKKDSVTGKALKGATFEVQKWNGKKYVKLSNMTDKGNGTYITDWLYADKTNPKGQFKIVEKKAPTGFHWTGSTAPEKTITFKSDPETYEWTVKNDPDPIKIVITKYDKKTRAKLTGAEFYAYAWSKSDGKYATTGTKFTDKGDGTYVAENLPVTADNLGRYLLKETKAPANYEGGWSYVHNSKTDKTYYIDANNDETSEKGQVTVEKVDENGQPLPDTVFKVYEWDASLNDYNYDTAYNTLKYDETDKKYHSDELRSDFDTTNPNRNDGKFIVKEVKAKDGYINAGWQQEVQIAHNGSGETQQFSYGPIANEKTAVEIHKVNYSGDILRGATFECTSEDGSETKSGVTGNNGVVRFEELTPGKWFIKETVAPSGYAVNKNVIEVTVYPNGKVSQKEFTVEDSPKFPLNITKVDSKAGVTPGANTHKMTNNTFPNGTEFAIYEWNKTQYNTTTPYARVYYSGGRFIDRETNDLPSLMWSETNEGKFQVVETRPTDGYIRDRSAKEVRIQKTETPNTKTVSFTNTPNEYQINKQKADGTPLGGVTFSLWNENTPSSLQNLVSASDGVIKMTHLAPGTWYYREVAVPSGYYLDDDETYNFFVDEDGNVTGEATKDIKNYKEGELKIVKKDAKTGELTRSDSGFPVGTRFHLFEYDKNTGKYGEMPIETIIAKGDDFEIQSNHYPSVSNGFIESETDNRIYRDAIAVIDTGVSNGQNVDAAYSVIGENAADDNGHGSRMIDLIYKTNPSAKIISIKAFDKDGDAKAEAIARAIDLAIKKQVKIINMSFAARKTARNAYIENKIQNAIDNGIIVVGAAGNYGDDAKKYLPGCVNGVITVGSASAETNRNADIYVEAQSTSEAAAYVSSLYAEGKTVSDIKNIDAPEKVFNTEIYGAVLGDTFHIAQAKVYRHQQNYLYDENGTFRKADYSKTVNGTKIQFKIGSETKQLSPDDNRYNYDGYDYWRGGIAANWLDSTVNTSYFTRVGSYYEKGQKNGSNHDMTTYRSVDDVPSSARNAKTKYDAGTKVSTGTVYPYVTQTLFRLSENNTDEYTLYGGTVWAAKYTVKYNVNGGSSTAPDSKDVNSYDKTIKLSSTTPTKSSTTGTAWTVNFNANGGTTTGATNNKLSASRTTSYSFNGWNTKANGSGTSYAKSGTYTFKAAQWGIGETLYAQWTSSTATGSVKLPTPASRTGYSFKGWYTAASGGTKAGNAGANYTPTSNNMTLYAQWDPNSYNVHFNANTGSGTMDDQSVSYGTSVTLNTNLFTKTGYNFTGWATTASGNVARSDGETFTYNVAGDTTLYAKWEPASYKIHFNANTGSGTMQDQTVTYGASVTLNSNQFTKTGYVFAGWSTTAGGNVERYDVATFTYNVTGDTTLYAKWNRSTYNITYNMNGGTNNASNPSSYTVDSGTITLQRPTREGFTFLGWTGSNGSTPQMSVIIPSGSTGNRTYTANWKENATQEFIDAATGYVPKIRETENNQGKFLLREINSAPGYINEHREFEIDLATTEIDPVSGMYVVTMENEPNEAKIMKVDENGNPLANATFRVWFDGTAPQKYNVSSIEGTYVSGSNGIITLERLAPGTWHYQETAAPSGYVKDPNVYDIEVDSDGNVSQTETAKVVNVEKPQYGYKIKKTTQAGQPLSGVTFEVTKPNGTTITTSATNSLGLVSLTNLDPGTYSFKEKSAPAGYILDTTSHSFTINSAGKATGDDGVAYIKNSENHYEIKKVNQSGKAIPNTEFEVTDPNGTKKKYTTDINGEIKLKKLQDGTWRCVETKAAPGYVLAGTTITFSVSNGKVSTSSTSTTVINTENKVRIAKKNESNSALSGVTFSITGPGGYDKTLTTNASGEIQINKLEAGTYIVTEKKTLSGYLLDQKPRQFIVRNDGKVTAYDASGNAVGAAGNEAVLTFTNEPNKITVRKVDKDGNVIQGAQFKFTYEGPGTDPFRTQSTYTLGSRAFTKLPQGKYTVTETVAPNGYTLNKDTFKFSVKDDGTVTGNALKSNATLGTYLDVPDERNTEVLVKLIKKDGENEKPLTGAVFALYEYDSAANNYKTTPKYTSRDIGNGEYEFGKIVIDNINTGKIRIVETKAPEGYAKTFEKNIVLSERAEKEYTYTVEASNNRNNLVIRKTDLDGNLLKGVTFKIWKKNNTANVLERETNGDGIIEIPKLSTGIWYVQETQTIPPFEVDPHIEEVTVDDNGLINGEQTHEITFVNKPPRDIEATVEINKVYNNEPLEGATFTLYEYDNVEKAYVEFSELEYDETTKKYITSAPLLYTAQNEGRYKVKETKAPAGFYWDENGETHYDNVTLNEASEAQIGEHALAVNAPAWANHRVDVTYNYDDVGWIMVPESGSFVMRNLDYGDYEFTAHLDGTTETASMELSEVENILTVTNGSGTTSFEEMDFDTPEKNDNDSASVYFQIDYNGDSKQKFEYTLENKPNELKIIKVDESGTPIPGVEFTLYAGEVVETTEESDAEDDEEDPDQVYEEIIATGDWELEDFLDSPGTIKIRNNETLEEYELTTEEGNVLLFEDIPYGEYTVTLTDGTTGNTTTSIRTFSEGDAYHSAEEPPEETASSWRKVTNANGIISFSQLTPGDYLLRETNPPEGMCSNVDSFTITVDDNNRISFSDNPSAKQWIYEATIVNRKNKIVLTKTDAVNQTAPVPNAEYALYNAEDEIIQTKTTDANGKLEFTGIPDGEFTIREETSPSGYYLDETAYTGEVKNGVVVLDATGNDKLSVLEPPNSMPGSITIEKLASDTGEALPGVTFVVYPWSETAQEYREDLVATQLQWDDTEKVYKTPENSLISSEENLGKFLVREVASADGYSVGESAWEEEIDTTQKQDWEFTGNEAVMNTPIEFRIHKIDDYTANPIAGVTFKFWSGSSDEVTKTTDANGYIKLNDLKNNTTYYYQETSTPSPYNLDSTIRSFSITNDGIIVDNEQTTSEQTAPEITINSDGSFSYGTGTITIPGSTGFNTGSGDYEVEIGNNYREVNFKISKVDQDDHETILRGAEFKVYEFNGDGYSDVPIATLSWDEDSKTYTNKSTTKIYQTYRNEGKFLIVETRAPRKYKGGWSEEVDTTTERDIKNIEITAENESVYQIPLYAGGNGRRTIYMAAIYIAMILMASWIMRKKKIMQR